MFSVVIPLYNKEKTIGRAMASVLGQTYRDFELIVVDDGSTDGSAAEAASFLDPRVRLVAQQNAGVASARNRGAAEASHAWVAFLDADDEWLPGHLQELADLKDEYPECDVCATNYKIVDGRGETRLPVDAENVIPTVHGVIERYFSIAANSAPPICSSAVAVSKKALQAVGGFPAGVRLGEDLATWAKLASGYGIAYSRSVTAIYHFKSFVELLDDEPMPDRADTVGRILAELLATARRDTRGLRRYIALWHRMRCNLYIKNRRRKEALAEIMLSLRYDPWMYKNYALLLLCLLPHALRNRLMRRRLERLQGRDA